MKIKLLLHKQMIYDKKLKKDKLITCLEKVLHILIQINQNMVLQLQEPSLHLKLNMSYRKCKIHIVIFYKKPIQKLKF